MRLHQKLVTLPHFQGTHYFLGILVIMGEEQRPVLESPMVVILFNCATKERKTHRTSGLALELNPSLPRGCWFTALTPVSGCFLQPQFPGSHHFMGTSALVFTLSRFPAFLKSEKKTPTLETALKGLDLMKE